MAKKKSKAPKRDLPQIAVPETEADARALAKRIGRTLAALDHADTAKDEAERKAVDAHAGIVGPLNDELAAATRALETYATRAVANGTLFADGKRSVEWAEAAIGFRDHPPAVRIAKGHKEDDIVAALLKARRLKFLRRKVELNREALLDDQAAAAKIAGIEIVQGETFFVAPAGDRARVALRLGKLKIEENENV